MTTIATDSNAELVGLRRGARTVKPRSALHIPKRIVAICGEDVLSEDGEISTLGELIPRLPEMHSTILATVHSPRFLARLNTVYVKSYPDTWQFSVTPMGRQVRNPYGVLLATNMSMVIDYIGWRDASTKRSLFHTVIDPVTMYGRRIDGIPTVGPKALTSLLEWAMKLRDFCAENNVKVRPTIGAIAAQFLRDPRFYPNPRRKVPSVINARSREHLPGNHYVLHALTAPTREYNAIYLDQRRAHHYHAAHTAMPDSDHCFAYGHFLDLDGIVWEHIPKSFYGMVCADLRYVGTVARETWLDDSSLDRQFIFTNEIAHLYDMGYRVTGVRAAWGSRTRDTGLSRYAQWADTQLDSYDNPGWLKPILLAAYGALAIKPRKREAIYRLAKSGIPVDIPTGSKDTTVGKFVRGSRKLEPNVAHVIQRAMIESATRSESVGFAQHLTRNGYRVLCIYADAVIIQDTDDQPSVPFLPEPWTVKEKLTHLQFLNTQAFTSSQMTKLPGVSRDMRILNRRSPAPHPNAKRNVAELIERDERIANMFIETFRIDNNSKGDNPS